MTSGMYEEPMARVSISRILEKVTAMESVLAVVSADVKAIRDDVGDLDTRVRSLEGDRFPWKVIGGIVGVAALILTAVIFLASQNDQPPPRKQSSMGANYAGV